MKFSDLLENIRSIMERNFRDTTDKREIDMKEVKERLTSLTASVGKSTQEGEVVERATQKKKL